MYAQQFYNLNRSKLRFTVLVQRNLGCTALVTAVLQSG